MFLTYGGELGLMNSPFSLHCLGFGGISGNTEIASGSGVASMGFGGASLSGMKFVF